MSGLSSVHAASLLQSLGPNALPEQPPDPLWRRFLRQFESPLIYILLFALAFDLGLWVYEGLRGWPVDAVAIAGILLLNAGLGLYQEQRSEAALARLKAMAAAHVWVLRDGQLVRLPSSELVPGDWVRLEAGDRVPADGTLRDEHGAMLDESVLTGESVPVEKTSGEEAFSGTLLVRGRAYLEVTRTGASSAMGRLAHMLGGIATTRTPLERRVDALGRQVARWVVGLAVTLGVLGLLAEGPSHAAELLIFAVALAVAAVPEGLPAVLTVALALGRGTHGAAARRRAPAVGGRGAGLGDGDRHRQDRHAHREPHGRALDRHARRAARAEGDGRSPTTPTRRPAPAIRSTSDCCAMPREQGVDVAAVRRAHPIESRSPVRQRLEVHARHRARGGRRGQLPEGRARGAARALRALGRRDRESWREKAEAYAPRGLPRPRAGVGRRERGAATDVARARAVLGPAAGRGAGRDRRGAAPPASAS